MAQSQSLSTLIENDGWHTLVIVVHQQKALANNQVFRYSPNVLAPFAYWIQQRETESSCSVIDLPPVSDNNRTTNHSNEDDR